VCVITESWPSRNASLAIFLWHLLSSSITYFRRPIACVTAVEIGIMPSETINTTVNTLIVVATAAAAMATTTYNGERVELVLQRRRLPKRYSIMLFVVTRMSHLFAYRHLSQYKLFPHLTPALREAIQMDEVSFFSVTDQTTAKKMAKLLLQLDSISSASVITEGTACVGGNVIEFSKHFAKVHAVEKDVARFEMLENNVQVIGAQNVQCHNSDYTAMKHALTQDIVFLDPPWGGVDYKQQNCVDLFMSGVPLADICNNISDHARYIVLKVPQNFNLGAFKSAISAQQVEEHRMHKMLMLVLHYNKPSSQPHLASCDNNNVEAQVSVRGQGVGGCALDPQIDSALAEKLSGEWIATKPRDSALFAGLCLAADGTFCCKNGSVTDGVVRRASLIDAMKINLKFGPAHSNDRVLTISADCDSMSGFCPQSSVEFEFHKKKLAAAQHASTSLGMSGIFDVKGIEDELDVITK
jgi:16S rRNA G966 N2-methylase RsmD